MLLHVKTLKAVQTKWDLYKQIYLILDFASIMPDNKCCFSPLWNFIEVIFLVD